MTTFYIQRKDENGLETVDETASRKDARYLLNEYRTCDPYGAYYVSTRACKAWRESAKVPA